MTNPHRLRNILRLDDFEPAARRHLPRPLFSYVSGGVEDNVSRSDNRAAFREWGFVPRVLVGVGGRSLATQLLSNHGGRQLDGAVSPLRVLPEVVAACAGMPVIFDSGVRRGTDVLKALALCARFVLVGRPFNYPAAIAGEAGVRHAIALLSSEMDRDMAMLGVTATTQLSPACLRPLPAA